jgi:hypothetical protein
LSHQVEEFRWRQNKDVSLPSPDKVSFIVRNNQPSALNRKIQHQLIVRVERIG